MGITREKMPSEFRKSVSLSFSPSCAGPLFYILTSPAVTFSSVVSFMDPFGQCGAAALPGLGPDAYMRIVASLRKSPTYVVPSSLLEAFLSSATPGSLCSACSCYLCTH